MTKTTTTPATAVGASATPAADPTVGFRRRAAAIALPLAFVCQLVCNALYAWASTSSGIVDTGSAVDALALYAAYPAEMTAAHLFSLVGCLLAVLGLPAALRVLRPARPRLAAWAVGLMIAGYASYFGINFSGFDEIALALAGADIGPVLDAAPMWGLPFALLFVVGNLLGTLLLGLAVVLAGRSRTAHAPWWAGLLIMGWTLGHVVNIVVGNEWFAVAGGALEIAGLAFVAVAALRTPNAEWAHRG